MTTKEWYSPHAVTKFTKLMVRWLIPHLPLLRGGEYPRKPSDSGYIDNPEGRAKTLKPGAKFETPAGIVAELDIRIQRAGVDGLLMEFLYAFEPADEIFVIEHIAQCLNVERVEITRRIRNALYYVSGADRKTGSYDQYKKDNYSTLRLKS